MCPAQNGRERERETACLEAERKKERKKETAGVLTRD